MPARLPPRDMLRLAEARLDAARLEGLALREGARLADLKDPPLGANREKLGDDARAPPKLGLVPRVDRPSDALDGRAARLSDAVAERLRLGDAWFDPPSRRGRWWPESLLPPPRRGLWWFGWFVARSTSAWRVRVPPRVGPFTEGDARRSSDRGEGRWARSGARRFGR